jgi:glycolate oxidase FAD binding subunit
MPTSANGKGSDNDRSQMLCDAVRAAAADGSALYLRGGGSKTTLIGRRCDAPVLELGEHRGVVSYRPEEMVLTARAGTAIRELAAIVAQQGQCLPFEPGEFGGAATLGGTLASGLSGPARPWRGSVRDAVLGIRLINGEGELLRFGGEVMKNVAGYDVSRLQSGALGTLGLISEVSLRLLPAAAQTLELERPCAAAEALTSMRSLARRALPQTGACWRSGVLYLRFEGTAAALEAIDRELDDYIHSTAPPWRELREWSLPELASAGGLWRFDLAPATPLSDDWPVDLIDWAGARRFCSANGTLDQAQSYAASAGGHASRLGCGNSLESVLARPIAPLAALQQRVKQALDPHGVFNPGRLQEWL